MLTRNLELWMYLHAFATWPRVEYTNLKVFDVYIYPKSGTLVVSLDEYLPSFFSISETNRGGGTPRKKMDEDVRLASQRPLPVYDQILGFFPTLLVI